MTFIKQSVICDACFRIWKIEEYEDSLSEKDREPWALVTPNIRGYSMVFTFCPECAKKPMTIPGSVEIVRRVRTMLR